MRVILTLSLVLTYSVTYAQDHWQHLDPEQDGILGVSAARAQELLAGKTPDTIVVAILDNGGQYYHPDLEAVTWVNQDEIAGNGIDDDNNGYIDDVHGWNFLGNKNGDNLKDDNLEVTRVYAYYRGKYEGKTLEQVEDQEEYQMYKRAEKEYTKKRNEYAQQKKILAQMLEVYDMARQLAIHKFGEGYDVEEIDLESLEERERNLLEYLASLHKDGITREMIKGDLDYASERLDQRYNTAFNDRATIIGDQVHDITDTDYGNPAVDARGPYHGTAVASLVGALDDGKGIVGIARNVKLMYVRVVPNGDERDKDVALGIRYAVRNGADIINCSFGKFYSPHEDWVRDALIEARDSGVLVVHAAGNDGLDLAENPFYPNGYLDDGTEADNWLNVGATDMIDDNEMVASFSNYDGRSVHLFAPGVNLETCALNGEYSRGSGTSFASPVAAGVAAVVMGYYPELSAAEIKRILIESCFTPKTKKVVLPNTGGKKKRKMKLMCQSGGIVNLYRALEMAEKRTSGEK